LDDGDLRLHDRLLDDDRVAAEERGGRDADDAGAIVVVTIVAIFIAVIVVFGASSNVVYFVVGRCCSVSGILKGVLLPLRKDLPADTREPKPTRAARAVE
jgi:hypothetical protein